MRVEGCVRVLGTIGGESLRVQKQGACNQMCGFDSSLWLLCGNGMEQSRWHEETAYGMLQWISMVADGGLN